MRHWRKFGSPGLSSSSALQDHSPSPSCLPFAGPGLQVPLQPPNSLHLPTSSLPCTNPSTCRTSEAWVSQKTPVGGNEEVLGPQRSGERSSGSRHSQTGVSSSREAMTSFLDSFGEGLIHCNTLNFMELPLTLINIGVWNTPSTNTYHWGGVYFSHFKKISLVLCTVTHATCWF